MTYTVASGDLPTFSPEPKSKVWVGILIPAGRNVSGDTRRLYWKMYKNGGFVAEGSKGYIYANDYWTISAAFFDVAVDDLLEIALWGDAADALNYNYRAEQVLFSRLKLVDDGEVHKPIEYQSPVQHPALSQGNSAYGVFYQTHACFQAISGGGESVYAYVGPGPDKTSVPVYRHHETYKAWRLMFGDLSQQDGAYVRKDATRQPYYSSNWVPTQILFRSLGEPE